MAEGCQACKSSAESIKYYFNAKLIRQQCFSFSPILRSDFNWTIPELAAEKNQISAVTFSIIDQNLLTSYQ